jgi:hypothetical protein
MGYKMKGFSGFGNSPLKDKQERQEKRRERQLKRAKKKDRWMHGQEMREEDGQLKTMEDHSWSTGDKEREVKDPYGVVSKDTPDYPSDDFRYYYKKNPITGKIKLLGKDDYPDLPPVEVKEKKKSPTKNYKNPQDYKVFNFGNKPTPVKLHKKGHNPDQDFKPAYPGADYSQAEIDKMTKKEKEMKIDGYDPALDPTQPEYKAPTPVKQAESTYVKPHVVPKVLTKEDQEKEKYRKLNKMNIDSKIKQDSSKIEDRNKKVRDHLRKKNPIAGFVGNVLGK